MRNFSADVSDVNVELNKCVVSFADTTSPLFASHVIHNGGCFENGDLKVNMMIDVKSGAIVFIVTG